MKLRLSLLLLGLLSVFALAWPTKPAEAACARCCNCETIRNYIVSEINRHEQWLTDTFWKQYLDPALASMTNNIVAAIYKQATQVGSFVEAQNTVDAQRMLQEMAAGTASAYVPSEELCRFGTLSQSLAESEANARSNRIQLMERSQSRQLGTPNMAASMGGSNDTHQRAVKFIGRYCDKTSNGGQMASLCTGTSDQFLNADLDYIRTFDTKPTLNVNFSSGSGAPSNDEQNILALADNLFASDLFSRPSVTDLNSAEMKDSRLAYLDMRALVAKRSVAENSFYTLVGQKSQGAPGSKEYMGKLLKELGIDDPSVTQYLGDTPSYDAQMEVLTKKIYQSPSFYVNLMETPANVERQYAAMQSFGLMQQRDIFDSVLRSEMLLSLIVELEVSKYQDEAQALMDKQ